MTEATITLGNHTITTVVWADFRLSHRGKRLWSVRPDTARRACHEGIPARGAVPSNPFLSPPKRCISPWLASDQRACVAGRSRSPRMDKINALVIDIRGDRGLIPYPSAIALDSKGWCTEHDEHSRPHRACLRASGHGPSDLRTDSSMAGFSRSRL
jgi:hypothetical protein